MTNAIVKKQDLHKAVTKAIKVSPNKPSLTILEQFLLFTEDGELKIVSTDLDRAFKIGIEATGELHPVCVKGKTLAALVKPDGAKDNSDVLIDKVDSGAVNEKVVILNDDISTKIDTMHSDDFPLIPTGRTKVLGTWKVESFVKELDFVLRSVCTDETRPHINSLAFIGRDMVCTDGHRLHKSTLSKKIKAGEKGVRVPGTTAARVLDYLKANVKLGGEVKLEAVGDSHVRFSSVNWELYSKVIEELFPPYDQVIPGVVEGKIVVDGEKSLKLLNRVKRFVRKHGGIRINYDADGEIQIETNDREFGDTETKWPVLRQEWEGEGSFGVNQDYLIDSIKGWDGEVEIGISGPLDPIRIELAHNRVAVVMPMRK